MLNDSIHYIQNQLYCDDIPVQSITAEVGTPVYIYSLKRILTNLSRIREAFAAVQPHIHYSAKANANLAILRTLVNAGAGVQQPGWSALHYAAFGGSLALVQLLLGRGARVDAVAPNGYTPLMLAVRNGHSGAASALLASGAKAAYRAPGGDTALGLAVKREDNGLIELLKGAGARE